MPRPKKVGAPTPKKRSRNGCWPCKSRKVKCDEEHPSCLNCQRQGETCDYSIRLNWEGRGKKKLEGDGVGGGQIMFSSNLITLDQGRPNLASEESTSNAESFAGTPLGSTFSTDSRDPSSSYMYSQRPSTSGSTDASEVYSTYGSPPTSVQNAQPYPPIVGQPNPDYVIDPLLTNENNSSVENAGQNGRQYPAQNYERFTPITTSRNGMSRNGLVEQAAIARFRSDTTHNSGPSSPAELGAISPNASMFDLSTATSTPLTFTNESAEEEKAARREVSALNPPAKRAKYESGSPRLDMVMLPPNSAGYSYPYSNTLPPMNSNVYQSLGGPLTPTASSTYSDDGFKPNSAKLSPLSGLDLREDPRRLSVESLLSGPPGIPHQPNRITFSGYNAESSNYRSQYSSSSGGDSLEEMKTYGMDRGFKDFDEGRNDDANAISGGSPAALRIPLEIGAASEDELVPTEFGFGIQAKDTAFEKGGYYQRPITIRLPRSFEPLPPSLTENPMNLLYFHHFISHTARILVPHHCSANPFQNILPKMALQDPNLMNLLLAYSASHRARLLQQPEPSIRIARWVQDIFPNLRHDLNDPMRIVSNSNLATAIMLASLEIISPKAFGVAIPWQNHLSTARQIVMARGGAKSINRDQSQSSAFLLRWFAYLDVVGSLIGGPSDLLSVSESSTPDYDLEDQDGEKDYQIDCLLGFTSRCVSILAKVAHLARICDSERIDSDQNIRPDWTPDERTVGRAEKLIVDLDNARTNTKLQPCPHLHSAGEAAYQWDFQEMQATNEAYHYAGLIHVHRRILGKPSSHPDVQVAVKHISGALYKVRKGSTAESCLLLPMFTAGCDAQDQKQRLAIMDRFRGVEEFGMSHVYKARTLMQRVWETGKPWETLVAGEFVG